MVVPIPTPIYRLLHIDNLSVCLQRGGFHEPNHTPNDGLVYEVIHNIEIQQTRRERQIPCGPGGVIHDYVSFYFGPRSPMLFQLHTGMVSGYNAGQEPLIYVVSTVQIIQQSGLGFVFSDGHGIAAFTNWFDDLNDLSKVDWKAVYLDYWADDINDMDRQRRKQAEFLVYRFCPWQIVQEIYVLNQTVVQRVENILNKYKNNCRISIKPEFYY